MSTQQNSHKRKTKARKKTHKPNCSKRNKKKRERERKQNNSIKPTLYFVFPLSQFPSHKPHQKNEHLNQSKSNSKEKENKKGMESQQNFQDYFPKTKWKKLVHFFLLKKIQLHVPHKSAYC